MKIYLRPLFLLLVGTPLFGQPKTSSGLAGEPDSSGTIFQPQTVSSLPADWPALAATAFLRPVSTEIRRIYDSTPERLTLRIPLAKGQAVQLELERIKLFSEDFRVETARSEDWESDALGIHYRGRIAGEEASLAAISIFPDEVAGFWSAAEQAGNWVLGRLPETGPPNSHVVYRDEGLVFNPAFICATSDDPNEAPASPPRYKQRETSCIDIFWEVDSDVFRDKGGMENTIRYMTSLFNQVAAVFARDDIAVRLAELYIWNAYSYYNGATAERQLAQFQERRTDWPGDLAQLLSYKVDGGIAAGVEGLCNEDPAASMCYAGISSTFSSIPNYSWTVNVAAHELGHLMGAPHTHACTWNGDGTSIDDCGNVYIDQRGGEAEGTACYQPDRPKYPQAGGTLMSYCHLLEGVGINLSKGLHEQPAALIQRKMAEASCLDACTPTVPAGACVGTVTTLTLTLDDFGSETTWEVRDENGILLYEGGPYADYQAGRQIEEELCLGTGCFTLEVRDAYGDGMCCYHGEGGYELTDSSGVALVAGGRFGDRQKTTFCLPLEDPSTTRNDCVTIDFNDLPVSSYGGTQDAGQYEIREEGAAIRLWGNAWKSAPIDYEIGPYTLLEFEFGSTALAEVHAIGLDTDDRVSGNRTFKLSGSQNWGILQYFNYLFPGEWKSFVIPVGLHYQGPVNRIFFCVDDDEAPVNGDSWFRNIRLYEYGSCNEPVGESTGQSLIGKPAVASLQVFPNPATDEMNIRFSVPDARRVSIQLLDMMGRVLKERETLPSEQENHEILSVDDLPRGAYLLKLETKSGVFMEKVVLTGSRP